MTSFKKQKKKIIIIIRVKQDKHEELQKNKK